MAQEKVCLVPWDPEDEQQYQRMYDQRIGCGWREGEVDEWRQKQLGGTKVLYWIVSSSLNPKAQNRRELTFSNRFSQIICLIGTSCWRIMLKSTPR